MLFIRPYRPRIHHTSFEYVDETRADEKKKKKCLPFIQPYRRCPGQKYHKHELLTNLHLLENVIEKLVVLFAVLALLMYSLYKWNCPQNLTAEIRHQTILPPCTWIDLTTVENRSLYFSNYNVSVTVTPKTPCNKNTTLLIIVHSRPKNRKARQAIRDTWASIRASTLADLKFQVVFLLGRNLNMKRKIQNNLKEEIHIYDDLILSNIIDSYVNRTLKSIAMLHWVLTFCPHVKHLMKADDDVYVNEQLLMKYASNLPAKNRSIFGYVIKNSLPHHYPRDGWYASRAMYPSHRYPSFVLGSSYLMTADVIQGLCINALMNPIIPFENLFITGICAEKAGVRLIHHPGMCNDFPRTPCLMKKSITMRYIKPQIMRYIWGSLRESGSSDCSKNETGQKFTAVMRKA